jgi:hypothetical protein
MSAGTLRVFPFLAGAMTTRPAVAMEFTISEIDTYITLILKACKRGALLP